MAPPRHAGDILQYGPATKCWSGEDFIPRLTKYVAMLQESTTIAAVRFTIRSKIAGAPSVPTLPLPRAIFIRVSGYLSVKSFLFGAVLALDLRAETFAATAPSIT